MSLFINVTVLSEVQERNSSSCFSQSKADGQGHHGIEFHVFIILAVI